MATIHLPRDGASLRAAIFDMDGVVTRTAQLHARAWKTVFDDFLAALEPPAPPFDPDREYRAHVDGKPRMRGVRDFLSARGIVVDAPAMQGLAARKDEAFERELHLHGVALFAGTVALIRALREREVRIGLMTSSRHGRQILRAAGISSLFDAIVDGTDHERDGLRGKPDPDGFLACAALLDVPPAHCVVFEDATAGVLAACRGRFGLVVAVDRFDRREEFIAAGADRVVPDLAEIDPEALQAAMRARGERSAWHIEQQGFDAARERQMESLFAIGNGALGVRAALDAPLGASQPDLLVAGVYDRKAAALPYSELEFMAPERDADLDAELVPLPFPFGVRASIADEPLDFAGERWRSLVRRLDLRAATLELEAEFETAAGQRTVVRSMRLAALHDPRLLVQRVEAEARNHWAEVKLEPWLVPPDLAAWPHLEILSQGHDGEFAHVCWRTRGSGIRIAVVARSWPHASGLNRLIAVVTSRDEADPLASARALLESLGTEGLDATIVAHREAWERWWSQADIRVHGKPAVEQALRFGAYHMRLPAPLDPRVSIGARSLTGRAYEGHVFWDAEVFLSPFLLHTQPGLARNLLCYRDRTLAGARRRARALGHAGACFAWESTVTGDDVTPPIIVLKSSGKRVPIFTGSQQLHVTAGVALAVWRYWQATEDRDFISGPGARLLFETARFWASRVERGPRGLHLRKVVGPDEYHHGVDDNAYTNWMVRFNLERAAWVAQAFGGAPPGEAQTWSGVARELYVPQPRADGVIEQFAGFFDLLDHPLQSEDRFRAPLRRLFDWETVNRMQLIKQADVLMLPWLFPEAFDDAVVLANYRYYEPRTDHGSSLSPGVHAAIAARLGLMDEASRYWERSLWLDLSDSMDNSSLGVHVAAMGASWQALVFGFLGMKFADSAPVPRARAAQRLPAGWQSVELSLAWRGVHHRVCVEPT